MVLGERVERGVVLARCWCWELVCDAVELVVGRVRNLVGAIRTWGVSEEKKGELMGVLEGDLSRMKGLFALVEEYVGVVASAQQDGMLESSDELRREEEGLLKAVGGKWVRAWRRKGAVEESWGEGGVGETGCGASGRGGGSGEQRGENGGCQDQW